MISPPSYYLFFYFVLLTSTTYPSPLCSKAPTYPTHNNPFHSFIPVFHTSKLPVGLGALLCRLPLEECVVALSEDRLMAFSEMFERKRVSSVHKPIKLRATYHSVNRSWKSIITYSFHSSSFYYFTPVFHTSKLHVRLGALLCRFPLEECLEALSEDRLMVFSCVSERSEFAAFMRLSILELLTFRKQKPEE